MKFFAFIISFYFLALSCFPCGDGQECDTKAEQKISATADHQEHQHQTENCTPFCICACCAASVFCQPVESVKTHKLELQAAKFQYEISLISTDLHSIWQPPKIS
jgi:hypothetical protein